MAVASFTLIPAWIALSSSLLSNIFATGAIGYKAWKHRRTIRANIADTGSRRLMTEKIMALIVESGIVYLCLWIFYLTVSFYDEYGKKTPSFNPLYAYCVVSQTMAAYPTVIIILVMIEKASFEQQAVVSTPSRVVLPPIQLTLGTIISLPPDSELNSTADNAAHFPGLVAAEGLSRWLARSVE
ncbi:hypothetical protein K488DRAFT_88141 [Vararia minispora EC-137]|uniref:Uncharacterized protein n=1 Tax=Vararia minispora EC-137 TaxID=1314806 RepID=A0ACB8QEC3_9AGAM|nr:hypothetical protein K488DRAFT_88141 [Vararia minispora EC-137]